MTDLLSARINRGQTTVEEDRHFSMYSDQELMGLINDGDPQKRTSSAKQIGVRKNSHAVSILCDRLKIEKALYTRIAISEALSSIGEPELSELIRLLGKVGNNQHQELPKRGFYKKSYPLPRDIAARTIIKIGPSALKPLEKVVLDGNRTSALEAIDAIGQIAFYDHDLRSEAVLLSAYHKYSLDPVLTWKIVRAFQAFPTADVRALLETIIFSSSLAPLRWEAVRSLGQHGKKTSTQIKEFVNNDINYEIKEMGRLFLK